MNAPLWTADEIAAATGARLEGPFAAATGASIDTRTLQAGDLFFAIRGEARDGHDFVPNAIAKGAAAAVVAQERAAEFAGAGPLVVVSEPLEAMALLGRAARARSSAATGANRSR